MSFDVQNKTILAVAAHPDDLDFGAAGSIAKWVKEGANAYYLILTDGSKGTEDPGLSGAELTAIRHQEQKKAAKVLGIEEVFFLDFIDGELMNTPEVRKEVVKVIRKLKPEIVITTDPAFIYDAERGRVNHPDHRTAGQITLDSVFPFARNIKTFPELLEEGHEPHSVTEVLLINSNQNNTNLYSDITETIDLKLEALSQHKSQHADGDFQQVAAWVTKRAKSNGEKSDNEYAESFIRIQVGN